MGVEKTLYFSIFILSLVSLSCSEPQVPCYFIFGDSLVDNGNNNDLVTEAKANYPPYGIDFPGGPSGRFTNGRNMADILAELLGFPKHIPPFATARGKDITTGVNYGSGAAGIRDETAKHMGERINMNQQLRNHQKTLSRLTGLLETPAQEYVQECLYTVGMGNNDYINNYLMPRHYYTSLIYTPERYAAVLVRQYSKQLKTLYNYGARKVGVFGAGYLGCIPAELAIYEADESSCVDKINGATILFNQELVKLIDDLNKDLPDAKFIYIGPSLGYNGLKITANPCCPVSNKTAAGQCAMNSVPCTNRNDYVFWDAFHPTEAACVQDAANAYSVMAPLYSSSFSNIPISGSSSQAGANKVLSWLEEN